MVSSFIILSFLATVALSLTHRHVGPTGNEDHFLTGRVGKAAFSVELKKDVLLWDELAQDGVRISSCRKAGDRQVQIELQAAHLDKADYVLGTAFAISVEDLELHCRKFSTVAGVSAKDPVSFFIIRRAQHQAQGNGHTVSLRMKRVHGSEVVPACHVKKIPAEANVPISSRIQFDGHRETALQTKVSQLELLPEIPLTNPDVNLNSIFPGSSIKTLATMDASIDNFSFTRLFSLEVQWMQAVKTNMTSRLTATSSYRVTDTREIFRREIDQFSERVPFFGTFRVTAFKKMDVVQSIEIDENVDAFVAATNENQALVTAKFSSQTLSIESLLPSGFGSGGEGTVDFGRVVKHEFGITGFYGVVPGVSIVASFAGRRYEAVVDVSIGLEASVKKQTPPFPPMTGVSRTFGVCEKCHGIRVNAAVVGKDLQTKLFEDGVLEDQETHLKSLFRFDLANICALEQPCPV